MNRGLAVMLPDAERPTGFLSAIGPRDGHEPHGASVLWRVSEYDRTLNSHVTQRGSQS